jgi:hypothetical protein
MTSIDRALALLDAANAEDPNHLIADGGPVPRAMWQGIRATYWLAHMTSAPSPALALAARAHHLRRWEILRADYPEGRAGYHRWKRAAREHNAASLRDALVPHVGGELTPAVIMRAATLVQRSELGHDAETQFVEDVACLVFLETQYDELIVKLGPEKVAAAVEKTLKKMSPEAIALSEQALAARIATRQENG